MSEPKARLVLLPLEPGRKHRHIAVVTHRGGGWYEVRCMGSAARCRAGECKHTASMRWADGTREFKQMPRA